MDNSGSFRDGIQQNLHLYISVLQDSAKDQTTMRGVQFIFKTQEGVNWIMFSSEPMNLVYDSIRKNTIVSSAPFTGIIRLAYIPALADDSSISSTGLRRLIYHAGVYPTGGDVAWDFKTSASSVLKKPMTSNSTSRTGTVHFNFKTQTMTDSSLRPNAATNGLLMLALPHHARLLPRSVMLNKKHFDLTYHCIKGPLTAVVGSSWTYEEPLLDLGFDGPLQGWDPSIRRTILDQVGKDLDRVLPNRSENIYGFGKQVARLAQLVHITHKLQVNDSTDDQAAKLLVKGSGLLQSYLEMFMSGNVADGVLYDSNMGGMVSANGLADKGEDFGNGRYNGKIRLMICWFYLQRIFSSI
jgi:endo-1,3(4)-beta-glucanase